GQDVECVALRVIPHGESRLVGDALRSEGWAVSLITRGNQM
ncbi:MAG: hypothetical protein ACJAV2_004304, partial [Myxococcota bacterium]